jgi:V8-like Glu-specific endopeptidase
MTLPLESALARFYTRTKKIEGAGLLVGSTTVLTCAHVVTRILGLPDNTHEPPTDVVYLETV